MAENKFVKSYPCSNRPVICKQCQDCYWSLNLFINLKQYVFKLSLTTYQIFNKVSDYR